MRLLRRIYAVAIVAVLGCQWAPAAGAQYACAMSGAVSASCCCAPAASDGCAAVSRACTCCDVSYTPAGPLAQTLASPVPAAPVVALLPAFAVYADAAILDVAGNANVRAVPARGSPPLFVLNHSFRC